MYERILVPIDGSPFSEQALPLALELAGRTGARLLVAQVHVRPGALGYVDGGTPYFDSAWDENLRQREQERLDRLLRAAREKGVSIETTLLDGPIAETLQEYAARSAVDLIVMATHARGGLGRVWMGSLADLLVRHTGLPVLGVRPAAAPGVGGAPDLGRVLVPLDGSVVSERVFDAAVDLAKAVHGSCTLLRVISPAYLLGAPPSPALQRDEGSLELERSAAAAYLEAVAVPMRSLLPEVETAVVVHRHPAEAILSYAAARGMGLIAMATHGRGGLRRLALGSVAEKVLRSAATPVLLVAAAAAAIPHGS